MTGTVSRPQASRKLRGLAATPCLVLGLLLTCACTQTTRQAPPPDEEITPPGTTLSLGETAILPVNGGAGVIELTVTEIERGRQQDLTAIGYERAGGETLYYAHMRARVGSGDIGRHYSLAVHVSTWADGKPTAGLVWAGTFPPCEQNDFINRPAPGTTVDYCVIALVPKGAPPPDQVRFHDDDGYALQDNEVAWTR